MKKNLTNAEKLAEKLEDLTSRKKEFKHRETEFFKLHIDIYKQLQKTPEYKQDKKLRKDVLTGLKVARGGLKLYQGTHKAINWGMRRVQKIQDKFKKKK